MANIDPLFVVYNEKGEIEGVKYDRLSVAFVNAFKEQQEQIQKQQVQIARQQQQIDVRKDRPVPGTTRAVIYLQGSGHKEFKTRGAQHESVKIQK